MLIGHDGSLPTRKLAWENWLNNVYCYTLTVSYCQRNISVYVPYKKRITKFPNVEFIQSSLELLKAALQDYPCLVCALTVLDAL